MSRRPVWRSSSARLGGAQLGLLQDADHAVDLRVAALDPGGESRLDRHARRPAGAGRPPPRRPGPARRAASGARSPWRSVSSGIPRSLGWARWYALRLARARAPSSRSVASRTQRSPTRRMSFRAPGDGRCASAGGRPSSTGSAAVAIPAGRRSSSAGRRSAGDGRQERPARRCAGVAARDPARARRRSW